MDAGEATGTDSAPQATTSQLVQGMGEFGFELHRNLPTRDNLVYSPLGVWLTLLTLVPGARGRTLQQLLAAGQPLPPEGLAAQAGALARALTRKTGYAWEETDIWGQGEPAETDLFVLEIATGLWVAEGHPFHQAFIETLREHLSPELGSVDFKDGVAAAARINGWADERTRGKIPSVVSPRAIDPLTRFIVANATYFKGKWVGEFEEHATRPAPFHTPGGTVDVQMMHRTCYREYVRLDDVGLAAVSLSYERMGALVILPDAGAMERVEASLSSDLLRRVVSGMRQEMVDLHFPRFDFGSRLELQEPLGELGIRDAFGAVADFGGISPDPEGLWISQVVHNATLKVDEKGTEAAAVTIIPAPTAAPGRVEPEIVELVVDRPFLFLVRDNHTEAVLFMARVTDPTG